MNVHGWEGSCLAGFLIALPPLACHMGVPLVQHHQQSPGSRMPWLKPFCCRCSLSQTQMVLSLLLSLPGAGDGACGFFGCQQGVAGFGVFRGVERTPPKQSL